MSLSNFEKHKQSVDFVSNHLNYLECNHEVNESASTHDIEIMGGAKRIKIFSNFARSPSIKIPNDFETEEGVLYMVVSPSERNNLGYISTGGDKKVVDDSIKTFSSKDAPKNIVISKLRFTGLKKYIE